MSDGSPAQPSGIRRLLVDLAGTPEGARFRPVAEIVLPLVVLALLTWWVRATGFDLGAQQWIHRVGGGSWDLGEHPFWKWLYRAGTVPAAIVVFAATGAWAWSWKRAALRPWRRVLVFVVLAGVIGPGIVTNAILKEYWGRPRPREIVEFGGRSPFEPVLSYDAASEGLSFPCGHATMGFYFLAGYFLLRRHRPGLAQAVLFGGLALGGLMGIARMVQGAHFFSDVVWAAAVCWFVPMGIYHALGLDRRLLREAGTERAMPLGAKLGLSVLALAMLAGVLLATPYEERRVYTLMEDFAEEGPLSVRLILSVGEVEIVPGEAFRIVSEARGHGVPTSKIGRYYEEKALPEGGGAVVYAERISGWFKEVGATLRVELPWERMRRLELKTAEASVGIELGPGPSKPVLRLMDGKGPVTVDRAGQGIRLEAEGPARIEGVVPGEPVRGGEGATLYRIDVEEAFEGELRVEGGLSR